MTHNEISHIYKNIFISNMVNSLNVNELINKNIHSILYLGINNKSNTILNKYKDNNIKHKFLKISDSYFSPITSCFEPAWEFINKQICNGNNILIHSYNGISRAPTIVAYYLTRKMFERMEHNNNIEPVLADVLTLIKLNRPCSQPNKYFLQVLKNYENIKSNNLVNQKLYRTNETVRTNLPTKQASKSITI